MKDLKLDGLSMDIEKVEMDKLKSVFPQCFNEGKLDIDKLLSLCGQYIDKDNEKYKFEWKGKAESYRHSGNRSNGTLRPTPEESVNFDTTENLYIEGDNLEVLKLLQKSYFGKVKMIYIDPPYNTGKDFVYKDDFKDPIGNYKEIVGEATKSNPDTMGRFHTNWLNMMYPRLRLAHNLLKDDGVIFISIDDNEVHNLRKICDEVFGEENFVAQIVWERAFAPVNLKKHFSENSDYILCYAKRLELLDSNGLTRKEDNRYKNLDNDIRGVWASADMTVGPAVEDKLYEIVLPTGRKVVPTSGRCWVFTREKFELMVKDNRIWFGSDGDNMPRVKKFLTEVKQGITPMTVWRHTEVGHSQSAAQSLKELFEGKDYFDYPKSVPLINRILELYTQDNDIIIDFFSGSATTAHAVMQLNAEDNGNRRFIMVQIPERVEQEKYATICEIGKERIRRAGTKILNEYTEKQAQLNLQNEEGTNLDIGFRVLKLDTSNLIPWDTTPLQGDDNDRQQELWDRIENRNKTIKENRTHLDIVFEVMLKLGIDLNEKIEKIKVGNCKCYQVGQALICLDHGITAEDITAFCNLQPSVIVAPEESFIDSTAMSNAHYILNDNDIEMKLI